MVSSYVGVKLTGAELEAVRKVRDTGTRDQKNIKFRYKKLCRKKLMN